jgi:hypothetical protein
MKPAMNIFSLPRRVSIPLIAAGAFLAGWCVPRGGEAVYPSPGGLSQAATTPKGIRPGSGKTLIKHGSPAAAKVAWNAALALSEGAWRDLETARAWRCLAESDPALAWCESFKLTEGAELRATLTPDTAAATAWISLTPDEHRANASLEAASLLMKQSPEAALQWAGATADPELRRDMEQSIIAQWASADPTAAAAWCDSRPGAAESFPAVIAAWAASDPMAASEWLAARPADASRDSSTLSLIEPLLELDSTAALAWAQTLTDPAKRSSAEERIAALAAP